VLKVSIPTVFCCCVPRFVLKFCHMFKLFRITKFRTRSDKSIRSSILSKLKKELASHFARCGLTDRSDFNFAYVAEFQYSTAYGRNIIPPHICYSIIVQMIDFLVNCISAPYIIKICDFVK
jgi:hypothetical protein